MFAYQCFFYICMERLYMDEMQIKQGIIFLGALALFNNYCIFYSVWDSNHDVIGYTM